MSPHFMYGMLAITLFAIAITFAPMVTWGIVQLLILVACIWLLRLMFKGEGKK